MSQHLQVSPAETLLRPHLLTMATPAAKRPRVEVAQTQPGQLPTPPGPLPTAEEVAAGTAPNLAEYMGVVVAYVSAAVPELLPEAFSGKGGMAELEPLQINAEAQQKNFSSYKQHWSMESCKQSLLTTQLYESGGCGTWLQVASAYDWGGEELPGFGVAWPQVLSALSLWAHERYVASAEEDSPSRVSLLLGSGLVSVPPRVGRGRTR